MLIQTLPIQNDALCIFPLGMEIEISNHITGMSLCLMKKAYQINVLNCTADVAPHFHDIK
jgi:hypothetical protein